MGRKYPKERLIPEQNRRICGGICVCQFTMVMSCVALVYLTVAIYIPSHRAFRSGLEPVPVMCQTIATVMASNCQWASCGEWCLTKTSGFCPQINVTVRRNGTDILLSDCNLIEKQSCPAVVLEKLPKYNCNNGSECERLTGVFSCHKGHCVNMSSQMLCPVRADGIHVNSERENAKLNGNFLCNRSNCTKVKHQLNCDRLCDKIEGAGKNVFVSLGDDVFGAECARAEALHEANGTEPGRPVNATEFWPQLQPPDDVEPTDAPDEASVTDSTGSGGSDTTFPSGGTIASSTTPSPAPPTTTSPPTTGPDALVVTCRDVVVEDDTIRGVDCLNGSLVPRGPGARQLPDAFNFTTFRAVYGWAREHRPADPHLRYAPPQPALTLYANSRLQINLEACVNTLQDECKRFLVTHGKDGRNDTAPSQFPCFFDKSNGFFVVARFDLEKTLRELVVAVAVPAALFVVSWVSLCVITRSVKVGDDARMRCQYCAGGAAADPEECGALAPAAGAGAGVRGGRGRRGRPRAEDDDDDEDEGARGLDPVERAAAAEAAAVAAAARVAAAGGADYGAHGLHGDDDEETELVMAVPVMVAARRPLEGRDNRALSLAT